MFCTSFDLIVEDFIRFSIHSILKSLHSYLIFWMNIAIGIYRFVQSILIP